MIIFVEKKARDYPLTQRILQKFPKSDIIEILHYKNIFDRNDWGIESEKHLVLAKLESPAITQAPAGYGHTPHAYFIKSSLGCIFDCSYCFLKGAFKTDHMVQFVNYSDIMEQVRETITEYKNPLDPPCQGEEYSSPDKGRWPKVGGVGNSDIWFYSGDYSDIQGLEYLSEFNKNFIPFFEQFEGVKMELRTKSGNIQSLLDIGYAPKNTEIAFSLNPQSLIDQYERKTSSLDMRITAINTLLDAGWQVGIRLLPLLPVKNYQKIYGDFLREISQKIDMKKISSSFASGLLYTKKDYNKMMQKYPDLDILHLLEKNDDGFYREAREIRENFYKMIKDFDRSCQLCLENF